MSFKKKTALVKSDDRLQTRAVTSSNTRRVKPQRWVSDDRASGLLDTILVQTAFDADAEQRRLDAERVAKTEAAQRAEVEAAERKRREGDQQIAEEQRRQAALAMRRTLMTQALRGEASQPAPDALAEPSLDDAATSTFDIAWDARLAKLQADVEHTDALLRQTMCDMTPVTPVPAIDDTDLVAPKRSFLPLLMAAMMVLLVGGAALFNVAQHSQAQQPEVRNPLAMKASYDRIAVEVDDIEVEASAILADVNPLAPVALGETTTKPNEALKKCRRGYRLRGGQCVKKRPTTKRCAVGKVRKKGRCVARSTKPSGDIIFNSITP